MAYSLPARDNIALGRHERFDDAAGIWAAARRAGADANLERLPHGTTRCSGSPQRGRYAELFDLQATGDR
jgi:ABC-type multidrug transport system fused ATPase/permease subunit